MKASWQVMLALLAVVLLAGCGVEAPGEVAEPAPTDPATDPTEPPDPTDPGTDPTDPGTEPTDPTEEPTDMDDDPGPQRTITGTLDGDPVLEGGCAWLETRDGGRYEVMWPEGYHIQWEPLELVGPDGAVVASAGDQIEVTGSTARDMASICMVGTIFSATAVSTP